MSLTGTFSSGFTRESMVDQSLPGFLTDVQLFGSSALRCRLSLQFLILTFDTWYAGSSSDFIFHLFFSSGVKCLCLFGTFSSGFTGAEILVSSLPGIYDV